MSKKTRLRLITVGALSLAYIVFFLLNYNHAISSGQYFFYTLIFSVLIPVCPSVLNYYFKKNKISCTRCGAENGYNDNFCNKCGMKLEK